MKSEARVVVIGGGIVGASVLYALTKHGWTDVMLLEHSDLTSGSTWHAARRMHTINGDLFYKEIEELSGQDITMHITGGVMMAATKERFDWIKSIYAKANNKLAWGILELITPQGKRMNLSHFLTLISLLADVLFRSGHVDGVTHAYAKAARKNGANYTNTRVEDLTQYRRHMECHHQQRQYRRHVVNCGGLWAREVGRMVKTGFYSCDGAYVYAHRRCTKGEGLTTLQVKEVLHVVDFDGGHSPCRTVGCLWALMKKLVCLGPERRHGGGHELLERTGIERIAPSLEVGFESISQLLKKRSSPDHQWPVHLL